MACTSHNGYTKTVFSIRRLKAGDVFSLSVLQSTEGSPSHDALGIYPMMHCSGPWPLFPGRTRPGRTVYLGRTSPVHPCSQHPGGTCLLHPPGPGCRRLGSTSHWHYITETRALAVRLWLKGFLVFAIFATLFKPYCIVALQRTSLTPGMQF